MDDESRSVRFLGLLSPLTQLRQERRHVGNQGLQSQKLCKGAGSLSKEPKSRGPRGEPGLSPRLLWSEYFNFGLTAKAHHAIHGHVGERVRRFLRRRHKLPRGNRPLQLRRGLWVGGSGQSPPVAPSSKPRACRLVKSVREPDAGEPHVRFDERGRKTEPRPRLGHRQKAKAAGNSHSRDLQPPRPSSTLLCLQT